jgi:ribosomal protein S18
MRIYVRSVDLNGIAKHENMDFKTVEEMVKYVTEQGKRVLPDYTEQRLEPTLKEFEWKFLHN